MDNVQPNSRPFPRRGRTRERQQLVAMQASMFSLAQDPSIPAHIRATCARAWSDLQERKRVLDGRPLPGQLRPDLEQRSQRKRKPPALLAIAAADLPATSGTSAAAQQSQLPSSG